MARAEAIVAQAVLDVCQEAGMVGEELVPFRPDMALLTEYEESWGVLEICRFFDLLEARTELTFDRDEVICFCRSEGMVELIINDLERRGIR